MLPLVGELAKPNRRATAISIVVSGLLLGILIARLISGVIAAYSSWRNVYWMSFALQYVILILLWLYLPDYPQTNKNISYFRILWSILEYVVSEPLLVQACLMAFFIGATFTSFWTTLTFLLSGAPYHYSTIVIGLFALAGIVPMGFGPFFARHFIDRFHTHASALFGMIFCLVGIAVGAYIGTFTVAGPILQAIVFDFGQQITQIANRTAIFAVAPKASNRINTAYMVSVFSGQLMGTAVGNGLYAQGGWIRSGSSNVGFMGAAILILLLRGPHETRWIGWRGGFDVRKKRQMDQQPAGRAPSQSPDGQQGSGEVDIEKEAAPKNSLPVGREEKTVIDMPDSAEDREEREKDIENA
jgi:predicted MFS family arabinose efflux permease